MEMIQTLLKFVAKMGFAILVGAFVWWLVSLLFPELSVAGLTGRKDGTSFFSGDWLPAPRNVSNLIGTGKVPSATDNVYVSGPAYNGVANSPSGSASVNFITYTTDGKQTIQSYNDTTKTNTGNTQQGYGSTIPTASRALYLRNLSVYDGQSIYAGFTFIGEARNSMFLNGRFPVVIVNQAGQVVGVNYAEATTNWAVLGWVRFQVKIVSALPKGIPCTAVFQSVNPITSQQVKVLIPVTCN